MNTACKTLASAAVLSLLSACATSQSLATVQPGRSIVQDSDYIAKVEDDASWNKQRKGMTKSTHAKAASQSW